MYSVTAILPAGQGIGFSMAGVRVLEASDRTQAHEMLGREMDDGTNGIILIDESFAVELPPRLEKRIEEKAIPLIVHIPVITRWEAIRPRDEIINDIIQRAVGYRIKFSEQE